MKEKRKRTMAGIAPMPRLAAYDLVVPAHFNVAYRNIEALGLRIEAIEEHLGRLDELVSLNNDTLERLLKSWYSESPDDTEDESGDTPAARVVDGEGELRDG